MALFQNLRLKHSRTFLAFARGMLAPRFTEAFAGCAMLFAVFAMGGFALAQRVPFNPLEVIWDPGQQLHLAQIYGLLALPVLAVGPRRARFSSLRCCMPSDHRTACAL